MSDSELRSRAVGAVVPAGAVVVVWLYIVFAHDALLARGLSEVAVAIGLLVAVGVTIATLRLATTLVAKLRTTMG